MANVSLPPGFRFHPTDVELVMYWLKIKVTGGKFPLEAISEIRLYNFAPWDLQGISVYLYYYVLPYGLLFFYN